MTCASLRRVSDARAAAIHRQTPSAGSGRDGIDVVDLNFDAQFTCNTLRLTGIQR
jgi:hypothetical protein